MAPRILSLIHIFGGEHGVPQCLAGAHLLGAVGEDRDDLGGVGPFDPVEAQQQPAVFPVRLAVVQHLFKEDVALRRFLVRRPNGLADLPHILVSEAVVRGVPPFKGEAQHPLEVEGAVLDGAGAGVADDKGVVDAAGEVVKEAASVGQLVPLPPQKPLREEEHPHDGGNKEHRPHQLSLIHI